jgi:5-formyltetrahydrofolate cyclo-ligase
VTTKSDLRTRISRERSAMDETDRQSAREQVRAAAIAAVSIRVAPGARIACYEPLKTEPGSIELLAELRSCGYEVLVPMTLPDNDLDWSIWTLTRQARLPLGIDAIGTAALILVPAFAVDHDGNRLGRGGGSYDRALARVSESVPVAALLYSSELIPIVPSDDWDHKITAVVVPEGWIDLPVTTLS